MQPEAITLYRNRTLCGIDRNERVLASAISKNYAVSALMINCACEDYSQYFPAAFSILLLNVPSGNLSMSNIALR
jgi:hypothetical protein